MRNLYYKIKLTWGPVTWVGKWIHGTPTAKNFGGSSHHHSSGQHHSTQLKRTTAVARDRTRVPAGPESLVLARKDVRNIATLGKTNLGEFVGVRGTGLEDEVF